MEQLIDLDTYLTLLINSNRSTLFDFFFYWVSYKFLWIPLYIYLLILLVKKYKLKVFIFLFAIVLLITLSDKTSVILFKNMFQRLRPCHNESINSLIVTLNNKCGGLYGFVSSHASNSFALIFFFNLINKSFSKPIGYLLVLQGILVCYSRIYLGVHFLGDVLFGALLGVLIAYLVYFLCKKIYKIIYKTTF